MTFTTVVGLIGGVFGIVLAVATVVAYFRVAVSKATIDTLKESNAALTERVTILERDQIAINTRNTTLLAENGILRDALSGKADTAALASAIEAHHKSVGKVFDRADERFTEAMLQVNASFSRLERLLEARASNV